MDVSIIIVNYNTYDLTLDCINSIKEKTNNIKYEIIVVDNNSPNRIIENLKLENVRLVLNSKNGGFGYANNIGNKYAKGKYLFFLNSDTILMNNAIFELFEFMEKKSNVGICGGNLYTLEHKPTISFERFKPSLINTVDNYLGDFLKKMFFKENLFFLNKSNPERINGYISGANFFIRKNIFDSLKGFDEDFFMYYEEVELSYRVNKLGFDTYVVPTSRIIHLEGGSQNKGNSLKRKWMEESEKLYYLKTNTLGYSIVKLLHMIRNFYKIFKF